MTASHRRQVVLAAVSVLIIDIKSVFMPYQIGLDYKAVSNRHILLMTDQTFSGAYL